MIPEIIRVNKIPPLRTPRLRECAPDTASETGFSDGRNDEAGLGDGVDCGTAVESDELDKVGLSVASLTGDVVGDIVTGLTVGSIVGEYVGKGEIGDVGRSPMSGTNDGVGK